MHLHEHHGGSSQGDHLIMLLDIRSDQILVHLALAPIFRMLVFQMLRDPISKNYKALLKNSMNSIALDCATLFTVSRIIVACLPTFWKFGLKFRATCVFFCRPIHIYTTLSRTGWESRTYGFCGPLCRNSEQVGAIMGELITKSDCMTQNQSRCFFLVCVRSLLGCFGYGFEIVHLRWFVSDRNYRHVWAYRPRVAGM